MTSGKADSGEGVAVRERTQERWLEVFATFLKLGLTSFGGPIAHLGYFHREIVVRRRWVDEVHYAQLLALCQFLPGPASSQVGFSLGLLRAGWRGGLAAFVAFTFPSVLLLLGFAYVIPLLQAPYGRAAVHGLKLLAVAVVAQGVLTMAERLTPDLRRRLIAVGAAVAAIATNTSFGQLGVIAVGAIAGVLICRSSGVSEITQLKPAYGPRAGLVLLAVFAILLIAALLPTGDVWPPVSLAAAFYRAGALVFGGGHVVLPLLQQSVVDPGWVDSGDFLAGYGAAQAVPGPMFSLAAFLGARAHGMNNSLGAAIGVLAIFLPGLLLVGGMLPFWDALARVQRAASAIAGVNAAVVGLLAAALYDPVWTSAVHGWTDVAIASVALVLLMATRTPVLAVLAACVLASLAWYGMRM